MSVKIKTNPLGVYTAYDAEASSDTMLIEVATDGLHHETRVRFIIKPIRTASTFFLTEEEAIALRDMLTAALPEMTAAEAA